MSARITPRGAWILLEKELKLLFKTKRRIFLLALIPIIIIIGGIIGGFAARSDGGDDEIPVTNISVLDKSPSNLTQNLKDLWSTVNNSEIIEVDGDLDNLINESNFHVFVYIPANFSNEVLNQSLSNIQIVYNLNSSTYLEVAYEVLILTNAFEQELIRLSNPEVAFDVISFSFDSIDKGDGDGDSEIPAELRAQFVIIPVYIIFFIVISPISLILISVTIEREQKTLEMLFLQPVKRQDIVLGKIYYGLSLILITLGLNIISALGSVIIFATISQSGELSEVFEVVGEIGGEIGALILIGFLVAVVAIATNVIVLAVLLSLMAKDEREANMISGILPMLIFGQVALLLVIPIETFSQVTQLIWVSLPIIGVIIAIYLSGLAGKIIFLAYLSVVIQFVWTYVLIKLITKISEAESITDLSYGKAFKEIKRIILRRKY